MTNTSQSFKFNLATPNLFLLIAFDSSINHTQGVINLELIKSSLKFMLEDIFQWFLKTVNANIGKQIKCKWKLIFKISTILQTTLAQKNKNKGSCSSSVFRVHACFTVCLAHCLSICLGIIFVNTVWAHTQTQAHAHMHTNHSSPAQDSELSLRFKVKEMQQVNWSLRGQQGLISLFYPIRAMKTGIDRCFLCLNVDD